MARRGVAGRNATNNHPASNGDQRNHSPSNDEQEARGDLQRMGDDFFPR